MFEISYKPYILQKKYVFRIAGGARSSTPVMLIRVKYEGVCGYGEASMPPLYGETIDSAEAFLTKVDLHRFKNPFGLEEILTYIDAIEPGNPAIKAAIDIALHDLVGKLLNVPIHSLFGLSAGRMSTSKTIGIDSAQIIAQRVAEANSFKFLKIKLGADNDEEIMQAVRSCTNQPLYIDANQGWKDKHQALEKIHWLKEQNVIFIEQPLLKSAIEDQQWLAAHSPLPIVGDESVQRLQDVYKAANLFHGVNIKLMKSTGLREAFKMGAAAQSMGLKIMLGCMSETSCAIGAAAQLGSLADWVDLDGNLGILNDPFVGHQVEKGISNVNKLPGVGLQPVDWDRIAACK